MGLRCLESDCPAPTRSPDSTAPDGQNQGTSMPIQTISFNNLSNNDGITLGDTNLTVSGTLTYQGSTGGPQVQVFITLTPGDTSGGTLIATSAALGNKATAWSATLDANVLSQPQFQGQTVYFYAVVPTNTGSATALYDFAPTGQDSIIIPVGICYYPGTAIATPAGEVAVETLKAGDLVLTADGRSVPVVWMGRQTIATRFADPLQNLPVRIRAGALAENMPARDLLVSPAHALLLGGVLVQAGALVNGTTITRETDLPERFTWWHVETADHSLILAEGTPAETFVDNVSRQAFDNHAEYAALVGEARAIAELDLPRAKGQRQVPQAVRAQIAERAAILTGAAAAAA